MSDCEVPIVTGDLDSMAVQFGAALLESELKPDSPEADIDDDSNTADNQDESHHNESEIPGTLDNKPNKAELDQIKKSAVSLMNSFSDYPREVVGNPNLRYVDGGHIDMVDKMYTCEDCGCKYSKASSFSNHRLAHHPSICPHCGRRFSQKSSLESHMQLECGREGGDDTQCHICFKRMSTKKILSRHLKLHAGYGNFTCPVCSQKFLQRTQLETHMRLHDNAIKPYKCVICQMTFADRSTVVRHVKKQHAIAEYNSVIETNLKPTSQVELANKMKIEACNAFNAKDNESDTNSISETKEMKSDNVNNTTVDNGEASRTFDESGMDESDPENDSYSTTFSETSGQDLSGKPFRPKKTFRCQVCGNAYNHSSSLAKHIRNHDAPCRSECKYCKLIFDTKHKLLVHTKTSHSRGKRYGCPLCDANFAGRSSVLRHLRNNHKYSPEEARVFMRGIECEIPEEENDNIDGIDENEEDIDEAVDVEEGFEGSESIQQIQQEGFEEGDVEDENLQPEDDEAEEPKSELVTFECSYCKQLFLEQAELKMHLCHVHKFSDEVAQKFMEMAGGDGMPMPDINFGDAAEEDDFKPGKLEDDINTTMTVTVEKDSHGVQKVVKVTSEPTPSPPHKPFQCKVCGNRFVEKSSVRRHLKRTHNFTLDQVRDYMVEQDYQKDHKPYMSARNSTPIQTLTPTKHSAVSDTSHDDSVSNNVSNDASYEEAGDFTPVDGPVTDPSKVYRTFLCTVCKKRFMLRSSVRRHMRKIHLMTADETRLTEIPAVDCVKGKTGRLGVDGLSEISCKYCDQKFTKRYNLKKHLVSRHALPQAEIEAILAEDIAVEMERDIEEEQEDGEPQFECSLCDVKFHREETLKKHLMKLHRLSEAVAERVMSCSQMFDYTTGLGHLAAPSQEEEEDMDGEEEAAAYEDENDEDGIIVDKAETLAGLDFSDINPWGNFDDEEPTSDNNTEPVNDDVKRKLHDEDDDAEYPAKKGKDTFSSLSTSSSLLPRTYDCPICGKVMSDASARAKHIRRHEGTSGFKCLVCFKIYDQVRLIESHLKTHSGIGLKCGICFIYCAERHSAKRHLKRIHNLEPNVGDNYKYILPCSKDVEVENLSNYQVIRTTGDTLVKSKVIYFKQDNDNNNSDYGIAGDESLRRSNTSLETLNNDQDQEEVTSADNLFSDYLRQNQIDDVDGHTRQSEDTELVRITSMEDANQISSKHKSPIDVDNNSNSSSSLNTSKKSLSSINCVINKLHKKLETVKDTTDEDQDSQNESVDNSAGTYSATSSSDLKLKIKFSRKDTPSKASKRKPTPIRIAMSNVKRFKGDVDDNNDESDSDKTVDFDDYGNNDSTADDGNENDLGDDMRTEDYGHMKTDVDELDKELMKAFTMPDVADSLVSDMTTKIDTGDGTGIAVDSQGVYETQVEESKDGETKVVVKHLKCWECGKSYSNYKSFREHQRRKHPLSCNLCQKVFVDLVLYQSHMESHAMSARVPKNHDCPVCGREFKDASSRAKHLRLHTGEKPYRCEECGKRFTQTGHLQSHMRIHNREKPFDCKLCGKFFTEKSSVKRHIRKMHYNQYNKKCDVCGIISKTREEHREHLLTHKQKVYSCELCQKDFLDSRALKVHTFNAHSKITQTLRLKEYRCEECDKQFFSLKGLKNHIRRHKWPIPTYKCGVCRQVFLSPLQLRNHMHSHVSKEIRCEECSRVFKNRTYYTAHKKYHIIEKLNNLIAKKEQKNVKKTAEDESSQIVDNLTGESGNNEPVSILDEQTNKEMNTSVSELISPNMKLMKPKDLREDDLSAADVSVLGDIDIDDFREEFKNTIVKVHNFANYKGIYFFRPREVPEFEEKKVGAQSILTLSMEKKEDHLSMTGEDGRKMRCLTIYQCSQCKVFQLTKRNILRHYESRHSSKQYQCAICSTNFSSTVMLQLHVKRTHMGGNKAKFKCQYCPKTFSERYVHKRHERRHLGDLPYECKTCHKRFISRYTLLFHMESHNAKPLVCNKCGTKFVHQRSYDNHQRAQCLGYRKRIAYRKQQNSTQQSIPGSLQNLRKYIACNYCAMMFNLQKSVEDHIRESHPEHKGDITEAYTIEKDLLNTEVERINMLDENDDGSIGNVHVDEDQFKDAVEESLNYYMKGLLDKGTVSPSSDVKQTNILIDVDRSNGQDEDCLNSIVADLDRAIVKQELEGLESY